MASLISSRGDGPCPIMPRNRPTPANGFDRRQPLDQGYPTRHIGFPCYRGSCTPRSRRCSRSFLGTGPVIALKAVGAPMRQDVCHPPSGPKYSMVHKTRQVLSSYGSFHTCWDFSYDLGKPSAFSILILDHLQKPTMRWREEQRSRDSVRSISPVRMPL